ncbi:MAG: hypothetical protein HYY04_06440, partial [Chloroflexi bacterium]|nr:hypothetical protein [Chloroflexota bacterium]
MPDYDPVDLRAICNAGFECIVGSPPPLGRQMLRGLPFLIGAAECDPHRCFVALGGPDGGQPVRVAIGRTACNVVFAHRLLETSIPDNGPVGTTVAEYVFHFADGHRIAVPIRERFEIAVLPRPADRLGRGLAWQSAATPFVAVSDRNDYLHPRDEGAWALAGRRQMEVLRGAPMGYHLWAWANPRPNISLEAIEIIPYGPRFLIAGITLGHVDEHPFVRASSSTVKITLPQPTDAAKPFGLDVEVDRGVASYPFPLPRSNPEEFLTNPAQGWGEPLNTLASPAYVEITAVPSATVTVKQEGEAVGRVRWGDLLERGAVGDDRLRLEWIDRGRNWVHTTVLDEETGRPVPCRIHFRSPAGVPY